MHILESRSQGIRLERVRLRRFIDEWCALNRVAMMICETVPGMILFEGYLKKLDIISS